MYILHIQLYTSSKKATCLARETSEDCSNLVMITLTIDSNKPSLEVLQDLSESEQTWLMTD